MSCLPSFGDGYSTHGNQWLNSLAPTQVAYVPGEQSGHRNTSSDRRLLLELPALVRFEGTVGRLPTLPCGGPSLAALGLHVVCSSRKYPSATRRSPPPRGRRSTSLRVCTRTHRTGPRRVTYAQMTTHTVCRGPGENASKARLRVSVFSSLNRGQSSVHPGEN